MVGYSENVINTIVTPSMLEDANRIIYSLPKEQASDLYKILGVFDEHFQSPVVARAVQIRMDILMAVSCDPITESLFCGPDTGQYRNPPRKDILYAVCNMPLDKWKVWDMDDFMKQFLLETESKGTA